MDLVLDPPRGVAPILLGMTLDETIAAVSGWGEPRVLRRPGRNSAKVSSVLDGVGVQALLEGGPTVTAVELWWPGEGRASGTRVLLDGHDVTSQPEYPVIPGVSLGFTRQTSQEVPRDAEGLPSSVTSVLVGGKDYYDHRYDSR
ncbi:hypothetical protein ABZ079_07865 [Streptomyces sp. NPDC006314]|uniref:hypothetical protein n=1 Tax=Streptomyces sp. NPDC006314 TaxID=3154475 RepID=UPI0033B185C4